MRANGQFSRTMCIGGVFRNGVFFNAQESLSCTLSNLLTSHIVYVLSVLVNTMDVDNLPLYEWNGLALAHGPIMRAGPVTEGELLSPMIRQIPVCNTAVCRFNLLTYRAMQLYV